METGNSYNLYSMPPPNFKGQQLWNTKQPPPTINSTNHQNRENITVRTTYYGSQNNGGNNNPLNKFAQQQYSSNFSTDSLQTYGIAQNQYPSTTMAPTFPVSPINYCTPPPYPPPPVAYTGTYINPVGGMYRPLTNYYFKRKNNSGSDQNQAKNPRKKKKPLSQNIPTRKDWSVDDAKKALEVEKEFNKRHKRSSLIIKFPDLELNREIVSRFHPAIDSVHFQQPSTPRYCFVTLKDDVCEEDVIKSLNTVKFGDGYLCVEHKKDKEDEINIGPEDIDPFTLYVGNLVQEVTKEDIVRAYPKQRRIDIGFAKKMKYTRYAFVCFRTVNDAIEAFQNTYATEMYSKSLIVRFRRLHGTHGMSGEPKPPSTSKRKELEEMSISLPNMTDVSSASPSKSTPIKQEPIYSYIDTNPRQVPENVYTIKEEYNDYRDSSDSSGSDDEDEPLPDCFRSYISNKSKNKETKDDSNTFSYNIVNSIKKEPEDNDIPKSKSVIGEENRRNGFEFKRESEPRLHLPILEAKMETSSKMNLPSVKYHLPLQLNLKKEDIRNSEISIKSLEYHIPLPLKSEETSKNECVDEADNLSDEDISNFL